MSERVNTLIIRQKFIFRDDLKNNPSLLYIFGDNLERRGLGGQAKEMRGEINAFGIATKCKAAHGTDDCYFKDTQKYKNIIDSEFERLYNMYDREGPMFVKGIVIPMDGIGTGLALLHERAPKLLRYINKRLEEIKYHAFN